MPRVTCCISTCKSNLLRPIWSHGSWPKMMFVIDRTRIVFNVPGIDSLYLRENFAFAHFKQNICTTKDTAGEGIDSIRAKRKRKKKIVAIHVLKHGNLHN